MTKFTKALISVALTEENVAIAKEALQFVHSIQAEAVLLHCLSEMTYIPSEYLPQENLGPLMDDNVKNAVKELNKIKDLFPEVPTEVIVNFEEPLHGIKNAISEYNCDLVILGASTKSRLEKFFLGSVASNVINSINIPVLLLR